MERTTNDTKDNEMTEHQVENEDTVEEIDFYELTLPGDDSEYYILEEEHETISLNYIAWVKF